MPNLTETALRLLRNYLALSTRNTYRSGVRYFLRFCLHERINLRRLNQKYILLFLARLFNDGLSSSTVRVYLAAISNFCAEHCYPDPVGFSAVQRAIKGFVRLRGHACDKRLPITIPIMRRLKSNIKASTLPTSDQRLLWAALNTALFGLFRVGELTTRYSSSFDSHREHTISFKDVVLHKDHVTISLRHSKCNEDARDQSIVLYATSRSVCPVKAIRKYFDYRIPLRRANLPFFMFADGSTLTPTRFSKELRCLLTNVPCAHLITSHSFRIGGATIAAENGISSDIIQAAGRWKSQAYRGYIRSKKPMPRIPFYPKID